MPRRPSAVARVLGRVTQTCRDHEMLRRADLVLVCVSGGPDSVCLLYSLWYLRRLFGIKLAVFHFDHGLRPDSSNDAAYVRRLAERLRLPFHLRGAKEPPPRGGSEEMWARFVRLRSLGEVGAAIGATRFADGHTLDDQAETVLMGLVLGWGPDGLGGIHPVNGKLVRPLLDVTRAEVEAFCRALRLRPRRDLTNRDTSHLRNAIRIEAIPAIERATGRHVKETFARSAGLLRRDAAALVEHADEHARTVIQVTEDGFQIPVASLRELPRGLAARVVRWGFRSVGEGWDEEAIEAVLGLAEGRSGRRRDLMRGLKAAREQEYVRVSRPSPPADEPARRRTQGGQQ